MCFLLAKIEAAIVTPLLAIFTPLEGFTYCHRILMRGNAHKERGLSQVLCYAFVVCQLRLSTAQLMKDFSMEDFSGLQKGDLFPLSCPSYCYAYSIDEV